MQYKDSSGLLGMSIDSHVWIWHMTMKCAWLMNFIWISFKDCGYPSVTRMLLLLGHCSWVADVRIQIGGWANFGGILNKSVGQYLGCLWPGNKSPGHLQPWYWLYEVFVGWKVTSHDVWCWMVLFCHPCSCFVYTFCIAWSCKFSFD